jgi:predicted nucleic acid-binding protein
MKVDADYIVTNDKHFNILKQIEFPKVNCITIEEFMEILKTL